MSGVPDGARSRTALTPTAPPPTVMRGPIRPGSARPGEGGRRGMRGPERMPSYDEEVRRPQTAEEAKARYRWISDEEAAGTAEHAATFRQLLARTAIDRCPPVPMPELA